MKHPRFEVKTRSLGVTPVREEDSLYFDHQQLECTDFSNRKLRGFGAYGSTFTSCRFENMQIDSSGFGDGREISRYIDCSFDGSRIRRMGGGYVRFERCSFRNTDLREWFCFAVEMVDCTFSGRMRKVIFNGTPRAEDQAVVHRNSNEFLGNDFSEVRLEEVGFRTGIDLAQQKLPAGPEYVYLPDAERTVRQARAEILAWKDIELRRRSMILMGTLEEEIQAGQRQMLFRAADYPKSLLASAEAIFSLFKRLI